MIRRRRRFAGLIEPVGDVTVDVYVQRETRFPCALKSASSTARMRKHPNRVRKPSLFKWIIDIYDVNAAPDLNVPRLEATAEVTPEATEGVSAPSLAGNGRGQWILV